MLTFLEANFGNIIVIGILLWLIFRILRKYWRRRKAGSGSCSSCAGCVAAPLCQRNQTKDLRKTEDLLR